MSMRDDSGGRGGVEAVVRWDGQMGIVGRADRCGEEREERI